MLRRLFLAICLTAALGGCSTAPPSQSGTQLPREPSAVPARALNPDVRPETIHQTICVSGYIASVRPSTSFTNGIKLKLMRDSGLPPGRASEFELDHRVALALGGHPRAVENLALQPWEGDSGAKRKDKLERRLQQLVCAGKVALDRAQSALYFDWEAAYLEFLGSR